MRLRRLLRRHRQIDHAEIELGGLSQQRLEMRRILQARHLHQDTVEPFTLDGRLDQADLVDAALDDLDRLIDGLANPLGDGGIGRRQRNQAAIVGDIDIALAGGAGETRYRLRQFAQLAQRIVDVGVARDVHFDGVAANGTAGERNFRLAENTQHIVVDRLQLLLAHRAGIDLQQKMRTALQIEP